MTSQQFIAEQHRRLIIFLCFGLGGALFLWLGLSLHTSNVGAQLNIQKVDDFEAYNQGLIFGQGGWVATSGATVVTDPDPNYPDNQVLQMDGAFQVATTFLADDDDDDLFFRVYRNGPVEIFGGGSTSASPTGVAQFAQQVGSDEGVSFFSIRNGEVFSNTDLGFPANTWHCVWISREGTNYNVTIKGGEALDPELQGLYLNRNEENSPSVSFLAVARNDLGGELFIDDIYSGDEIDPFNQHVPGCPGGFDNFSTQSSPSFNVVDDFSGYPLGTFDNNPNDVSAFDGWDSIDTTIETDPADSNNQVLALRGDDAHAKRLFEDGLVSREATDSASTLFFRMFKSGTVNGFGGTSDEPLDPNSFGSFVSQLGFQTSSNTAFFLRDGDRLLVNDNALVDDTWYCVWQHLYYEDDTYRVYVQGGAFNQPTLMTSGSISQYDFRSTQPGSISDFFARTGDGHTGLILFDDLAWTVDVNLAMPFQLPSSECGKSGTPADPEPTATPTSMPTSTPTATVTPAPSNTPTPGSTAGPLPSVTPVPSSTPQPTSALPTNTPLAPTMAPINTPDGSVPTSSPPAPTSTAAAPVMTPTVGSSPTVDASGPADLDLDVFIPMFNLGN